MSKDFFCERMKEFFCAYQPQLKGETEYSKAAVMLPLLEIDRKQCILFEVRSADLNWQPGEICFPGGRIEASDADAQSAAARETCEELNLKPENIEIYGPLDYIATQMGVLVYPFVGKLHAPEKIVASKDEVAEIFTVPLDELLHMQPLVSQVQVSTQPASENFPFDFLPEYSQGPKLRKKYDLYFYYYGKHVIWGLTARILKDFLALYRKNCSS